MPGISPKYWASTSSGLRPGMRTPKIRVSDMLRYR